MTGTTAFQEDSLLRRSSLFGLHDLDDVGTTTLRNEGTSIHGVTSQKSFNIHVLFLSYIWYM
jgi:hypothetical protein